MEKLLVKSAKILFHKNLEYTIYFLRFYIHRLIRPSGQSGSVNLIVTLTQIMFTTALGTCESLPTINIH